MLPSHSPFSRLTYALNWSSPASNSLYFYSHSSPAKETWTPIVTASYATSPGGLLAVALNPLIPSWSGALVKL
jgi:hypothetical protein